MAQVPLSIPVYMPDTTDEDRRYNKSQGLLVINDDGTMQITMRSKQHAMELYELFKAGNLVACGFDYLPPTSEENTDG